MGIKNQLLADMLEHCQLTGERAPKDDGTWKAFLEKVETYFDHAENNRYLLEQSLEISSQETQGKLDKINKLLDVIHLREMKYRAMSDASPMGLFVTDQSDQCTYANHAMEQFTGKKAEYLINHGWLSTMHPHDQAKIQSAWAKHIASEKSLFEDERRFITTNEDGQDSIKWGAIKAAKIVDNQRFVGMIGIIEDLTPRKISESLLIAQNELYRLIATEHSTNQLFDKILKFSEQQIEHSRAAILSLMPDKEHLHCLAAPSLSRRFAEEQQQIPLALFEIAGEPHVMASEAMIDLTADHPSERKSSKLCQILKRSAEAKVCWTFPLKDEDGDFFGFYVVYFDREWRPTEHHRRVIQATCNSLAIVYNQETQKNALEEERLKLLASNKLASIGEMAGGLAHEINNPLAIIKGFAEMICIMVASPDIDYERLKGVAGKIEKTVNRITKIVKGLKNFSRDGSHDEFEFTTTGKMLDETLDFCRERFKTHGIGLHLPTSGLEIEVQCQKVQLSQVILNLLNNAYDAMDGIDAPWVRISIFEPNEHEVEFAVIDAGLGVPKEVADKMLLPFFTTKKVGQGTGLGLSICKGIIDKHHGRLEIGLEDGHTKISFTIPKKAPKKKREAQPNRRAS